MRDFAHVTLGQRLLFGTGSASIHLAAEVERLGAQRVMLLASEAALPSAQQVCQGIDVALVHTNVVQHVPIEVAEIARSLAREHHIDLLVTVGGGSAIGLAKAIALTERITIVTVPTTYAGSEATNVWGLTENARKTTGVDDAVLPASVIYDAELTLTLPVELSVSSGLNAMAHCVDALWAPRADPLNAALAEEGIRALAAGLRLVHSDPHDLHGRELTLYGAYPAAVSFASAGSGIHHKICHVLGGTYALPHAQTHAVVLPHVLAFNAPAAPAAAARVARALDGRDPVTALGELYRDLNAPRSLADLGFSESSISEAADIILPAIPASNPREVSPRLLAGLLHDAWAGAAPGTSTSPLAQAVR
ncbi:MAG: maleylacetate reductase [Subtercola sp.]|nr:maleylacetate reductase [Subtercola sp.]